MSRNFILLLCLFAIPHCLRAQSDPPVVIDSLKGLLDSRSGPEKAELLVQIARVTNSIGKYDSVVNYANEALALLGKDGPETLRIDATMELSVAELNLGDHVGAMDRMRSVLQACEKINDSDRISISLHNIGTIYTYDKQFRQAIEHFMLSIRMREELGDSLSSRVVRSKTMLGQAYMFSGSYDTSLVWLSQAYRAAMMAQNDESTLGVVYYLGLNYRYLRRFDEALDAYFEARQMATVLGNKAFLSGCYQSIAGIYDLQGKHELAILHLDSALQIAKEIDHKSLIFESLYGLAVNYRRSGQHARAYDYLKLHIAARDSVLKEQNAMAMADLKAKYEEEKRDQKIALLESQDESKRLQLQAARYWQYGLWAGVLLFALVILVLLNRFLIKRRLSRQLLNANQELEIEKENMEPKALLSQMNPHFIFNTLNSIQEFIALNDKKQAHEYLSLFGRLIRRTLENSDRQMVPIAEEIHNIEDYVRLESLRVENFTFTTEISQEIDIHNLCIPPMLIQPYIENAIWHGVTMLDRPGKVKLKMDLDGERLKCTVRDDGIGRRRSSRQKVKSELRHDSQPGGMSITRKRVQALWAKRKHDFDVEITDLYDEQDQSNGTIVQLDIPYEY